MISITLPSSPLLSRLLRRSSNSQFPNSSYSQFRSPIRRKRHFPYTTILKFLILKLSNITLKIFNFQKFETRHFTNKTTQFTVNTSLFFLFFFSINTNSQLSKFLISKKNSKRVILQTKRPCLQFNSTPQQREKELLHK